MGRNLHLTYDAFTTLSYHPTMTKLCAIYRQQAKPTQIDRGRWRFPAPGRTLEIANSFQLRRPLSRASFRGLQTRLYGGRPTYRSPACMGGGAYMAHGDSAIHPCAKSRSALPLAYTTFIDVASLTLPSTRLSFLRAFGGCHGKRITWVRLTATDCRACPCWKKPRQRRLTYQKEVLRRTRKRVHCQ